MYFDCSSLTRGLCGDGFKAASSISRVDVGGWAVCSWNEDNGKINRSLRIKNRNVDLNKFVAKRMWLKAVEDY